MVQRVVHWVHDFGYASIELFCLVVVLWQAGHSAQHSPGDSKARRWTTALPFDESGQQKSRDTHATVSRILQCLQRVKMR